MKLGKNSLKICLLKKYCTVATNPQQIREDKWEWARIYGREACQLPGREVNLRDLSWEVWQQSRITDNKLTFNILRINKYNTIVSPNSWSAVEPSKMLPQSYLAWNLSHLKLRSEYFDAVHCVLGITHLRTSIQETNVSWQSSSGWVCKEEADRGQTSAKEKLTAVRHHQRFFCADYSKWKLLFCNHGSWVGTYVLKIVVMTQQMKCFNTVDFWTVVIV